MNMVKTAGLSLAVLVAVGTGTAGCDGSASHPSAAHATDYWHQPAGCKQAKTLMTMARKSLKIGSSLPGTDELVTAAELRATARVSVPSGHVRNELLSMASDIENLDPAQLQTDITRLETTCGWN